MKLNEIFNSAMNYMDKEKALADFQQDNNQPTDSDTSIGDMIVT